ncbi:MAG TPA: NAD(P)H-dependent oxidoreductase [Stellaceae bacterium]|nr:NAD(P)H-dependent oxidoreductase [Stellaceae bacterium]
MSLTQSGAMRILVVHAHPLRDSFTAVLRDAIVAKLREGGHEVDECDLYGEGFDPVLTAEERRAYNTTQPDMAAVEPYVARLRAAEALVFCFPTWWYGMPAILKGWFDRVWVTGVAFTLPEGGGAIRPALHNVRKFAVVTTYGSPWWLVKLVLRDPVRAVLLGGLRRLCAKDCRSLFLALYNIDVASRARCDAFRARVERAFARF